ncbi:MAG TPA: CNNM domain-containing protein, partial [Streptosporangiaceae bacterium]
MGWLVAVAPALAIVAGLCASAEVAIIRASRAGARELGRASGSAVSTRVEAVLTEPSRYLSVLLLVRVGAETSAIVFMTVALVHWLGDGWHAFLVAVAVMAGVLYVVAGIWPRTLGRQYDRQLAVIASGILYPVVRALGPLPRVLLEVGGALTPGRAGRDRVLGSQEELRGLVDLLEERRTIEPTERAMIHSVFELGDTIVREVMVPRTDIVFVERDRTVRQALSLALRSGFSRIPVVGENEDDVIGIAYLKDL